jgi:L-ribulose-5-phosphate 4-epimerase
MNKFKTLREQAYQANMEIPARGLALYTWGNVSAFDRAAGVFAIKPSGVPYETLQPDNMVIVDLEGRIIDSRLHPSSDTKTHLIIYKKYGERGIGGVSHTHSTYATAWAQAGRDIPVLGTTHADYLTSPIPCSSFIDESRIQEDYERSTGELIIETFLQRKLDPFEVPMILIAGHGAFTWGADADRAVHHAAVLEEIARMAAFTMSLNPHCRNLPEYIIRKHWERKHGKTAYYGQ